MGITVSPQKKYIGVLIPMTTSVPHNVMLFGDRTSIEVIKLK